MVDFRGFRQPCQRPATLLRPGRRTVYQNLVQIRNDDGPPREAGGWAGRRAGRNHDPNVVSDAHAAHAAHAAAHTAHTAHAAALALSLRTGGGSRGRGARRTTSRPAHRLPTTLLGQTL